MSDPYKRAVAARLAILPAYVDSFELDVHLVVTRHPEWARAASDGIEAAFNQRLSPRGARLFPSASVQNISGYQELRKWSYQMAREIYKHPWAGVG